MCPSHKGSTQIPADQRSFPTTKGQRGEKQIREEIFEYMLSIEVCKNILKEDGLRLNDSQVKEVRDFLYAIAHIELRALNDNEEENKEGDSYGN